MEMIKNINEEIVFTSDINISLANAIRRSVGEINVLAIDECDIYKNDSSLYDEIIAHRLGLISLRNQKMKSADVVEFKLKVKGKGDGKMVLAGELGDDVVYPETPIVLLSEGQQLELVARARIGKGINHAKFMPGLVYYKHLPRIKISGEGEKQTELVALYPEVFEMYGEKVRAKDAWKCDLDNDDMKEYPGVEISFGDSLVFVIESWGQMEAKKIFVEACKALKSNLSEVSKALK
ncbi:DNA-directed RNA polymerase subunit D [Candidatus Pacearchaeota archaeon]|nr:DNA-directed RNA polymerase subunit D [Candidatus Pacearchaeota archaeon]